MNSMIKGKLLVVSHTEIELTRTVYKANIALKRIGDFPSVKRIHFFGVNEITRGDYV